MRPTDISSRHSTAFELVDRIRASGHLMPLGTTVDAVMEAMQQETLGPDALVSHARNLGALVAAHLLLLSCEASDFPDADAEFLSVLVTDGPGRRLAAELLGLTPPAWLGETVLAKGIGLKSATGEELRSLVASRCLEKLAWYERVFATSGTSEPDVADRFLAIAPGSPEVRLSFWLGLRTAGGALVRPPEPA